MSDDSILGPRPHPPRFGPRQFIGRSGRDHGKCPRVKAAWLTGRLPGSSSLPEPPEVPSAPVLRQNGDGPAAHPAPWKPAIIPAAPTPGPWRSILEDVYLYSGAW